jgi:hypothetical protein
MGMFDYFHSSYDLGEGFTGVLCQTKDIEDGIGGTMTNYWLDPNGCLWHPDYAGTHTFETIEEDDPRYSEKKFLNFEWVPTGEHGKYRPHLLTKYIEIHPATWRGEWEDWPRMTLHFKSGKLVEYRRLERGEAF